MNTAKKCPKCDTPWMKCGFIREIHQGEWGRGAWIEGDPSRIMAPQEMFKVKLHDLTAFRCTSCGYVEIYAGDGKSVVESIIR